MDDRRTGWYRLNHDDCHDCGDDVSNRDHVDDLYLFWGCLSEVEYVENQC